jgi:hypothetical protein
MFLVGFVFYQSTHPRKDKAFSAKSCCTGTRLLRGCVYKRSGRRPDAGDERRGIIMLQPAVRCGTVSVTGETTTKKISPEDPELEVKTLSKGFGNLKKIE